MTSRRFLYGADVIHYEQWQRQQLRNIAEVFGMKREQLMPKIAPSDQMEACTAAARFGFADATEGGEKGLASIDAGSQVQRAAYELGKHMARNGLGRPFQCTGHLYPGKVLHYVRSDTLQHGSVFHVTADKVERVIENALASGW